MKKITVNQELCDGCLDCQKSCESLHSASRITILEYDSSYYPILCQQCDDAPCIKICPTEAMDKEGVDADRCIGCGLCSMVCPFGAIENADSVAEKCNRCADRAEGPACIKACSKRAIAIVDTDNLKAQKQAAYIAKLAGKTKKKNNGFVNIITSGSRVNKTYEE